MAGSSLQSQGYLPVATATLFPATEIRCDLYLPRGGHEIELYRSHQYPLEKADLERLRQHGIDHVYIRTADADLYRQYLCQQVLHEATVPAEVRITALREVTRVAFQDAMDANDPHQAAELAGLGVVERDAVRGLVPDDRVIDVQGHCPTSSVPA